MIVMAIDPGPVESAWLTYDGARPIVMGISSNKFVLDEVWKWDNPLVIEKVESYGMPVGEEVFETVYWTGRFAEAFAPLPAFRLPRRKVKLHLCGSMRATDATIRQALIDRFGGSSAKGTKAKPGPLYGVARDLWSALALAVTFYETELPGLGE